MPFSAWLGPESETTTGPSKMGAKSRERLVWARSVNSTDFIRSSSITEIKEKQNTGTMASDSEMYVYESNPWG